MNILMVGAGKGSWTIRGLQLGAAIGARVTTDPTPHEWHWADRVVLVKNHGARFAPQAHAAGVPIIWDALDFWRQPAENQADESRARALLQAQITAIKPALVIGATQAMADACGGVYLPHHSRADLEPTNARKDVQVVAYEGNPLYLGAWKARLEHACQRRGWSFVINPPDLAKADMLIALREGPWDGWICREWKSGVKVVNAIAAGRPLITQQTAAVRELRSPGSVVESERDLQIAFDVLSSWEWRTRTMEECEALAPSLQLQSVAARYLAILQTVEARCAA